MATIRPVRDLPIGHDDAEVGAIGRYRPGDCVEQGGSTGTGHGGECDYETPGDGHGEGVQRFLGQGFAESAGHVKTKHDPRFGGPLSIQTRPP